jgi:hypothetical protein
MSNYEVSDYVEVRPEDGGYRIYSHAYPESNSWRGDGVLFRNKADAEICAKYIAKACYAEDMRTRSVAADLS